jgi:Ca2+-dependent lipid-binding protein
MWPYAKVVLARSLKESLEAELELVKPTIGMTELGIRSLNFGVAAPTINGIKCLEKSGEGRVTVDVDLLVVTRNAEVVVSLANPLLHMATNIELSDVVLRGTMRFELKSLFPWWPTCGAVAVSFLEKPTIDFELKTLHINVMELPAMSPILHKAINSAVERRCLWPRTVLIPFVDEQSMLDAESLTTNRPLGMLVIRGLHVRGISPTRAFSR